MTDASSISWLTGGPGWLRGLCAAASAVGVAAAWLLGRWWLRDARRLNVDPRQARSPFDPIRWYRYLNPVALWVGLNRHRFLLRQLVGRDVQARYKGSYLGILWSMITPVMMLAIYTFVFSVVFQARWRPAAEVNRLEFAITLYAGLIAFNVFSECATRATTLVVSSPSYVKRVVFPLEVLPVSVAGSALFHAMINAGVLTVALPLVGMPMSKTVILLPLAAVPLVALSLGVAWLLASLGVYLRDTAYAVGILTQMLFFLTPLFYPVEAVPARFRAALYLNPLTVVVDGFRRVLVWNEPLAWSAWVGVTALSSVAMLLGYAWFMKTKAGFANVM